MVLYSPFEGGKAILTTVRRARGMTIAITIIVHEFIHRQN
jgi:hypothetical protein